MKTPENKNSSIDFDLPLKFKTGNVVKLSSGYLVIISEVTSVGASWVSFNTTNSSGFTKAITLIDKIPCNCIYNNDDGLYEEDCEDCKGTGTYVVVRDGMDKAKVVGENVKEYIIKKLTKNFDW